MEDVFPREDGESRRGHEANTMVVKGLVIFAVVLVARGHCRRSLSSGLCHEGLLGKEETTEALAPSSRTAMTSDAFPLRDFRRTPPSTWPG